jgi:hypothetical protein
VGAVGGDHGWNQVTTGKEEALASPWMREEFQQAVTRGV